MVLSSETLGKLAELSVKALHRSRRKTGGVDATSSGMDISGTRETPMTSAAKSASRSQNSANFKGWNNDDIARLFRILERSMLDAENLKTFADDHYDRQRAGPNASSSAVTTPSPTKGTKPTKKKLKPSPTKAKDFKVELEATKVESLHRDLQKLEEAVMAAGICLCILSTGELPKQVRVTFAGNRV